MIYEIHFINLCLERYSLFRILLGFSFLRAAIQFNKNLSNLGYAIYLQIFHGMLSLQYQHFQSFNPRNRAPFMLLYQTINIFELRITFNVKHCQMHNGPKAWVVLTQILMKFHLQKQDQASPTKSQEYTDQTSASKSCLNFNLIKLLNTDQTPASNVAWLLTSDQTLCFKSEQKFSFMTKPQLPNLQQTVGGYS